MGLICMPTAQIILFSMPIRLDMKRVVYGVLMTKAEQHILMLVEKPINKMHEEIGTMNQENIVLIQQERIALLHLKLIPIQLLMETAKIVQNPIMYMLLWIKMET